MAANKIYAVEIGAEGLLKIFLGENCQILLFVLEYKTRKGHEQTLKNGNMLASALIEPCHAVIHLVHQCSQCGFQEVIK